MKATSNFYFNDKFYRAGDDVPKGVVDAVGSHLFASPSETPQKAPETPDEVAPRGDDHDDAPEAPQEPSKDRSYFEDLTNDQLVEEAKVAGISGRNTKDELIKKLVEHYG
jgi:hypothetical protein